VSDAANALGVSANTLRRWADSGRITAIRTAGGHRRFEASELRRLGTMVDDRPALRRAPVPSIALPALDELLAKRGVDVAAAAANAIYEGPRLGWFRVDASRASMRTWELGLRTAARSGDYSGAVSATGRLVANADFAGASLLERHAFVERYGEVSVRLLQRSGASRVELLDVRRLFARLRESVLEGDG
jgi:excisionase family DNA binding protein